MQPIKSPLGRFLVHVVLLAFTISSVLPFVWTFLTSLKLPRDATALPPKIIGFEVTTQNYVNLWLNSSAEAFAPVGVGLLLLIAVLLVLGTLADRLPVPPWVVYTGIVVTLIAVVLGLPRVANMAEFYTYFLNSVIVTVITVCISIAIGIFAGYGLARYTGFMAMVVLVAALVFRALPSMTYILPYFYMGQQSGLYDTYFLLIVTLVAVNQPFTIWMLRSFFIEIPPEIEEAAMMDGASRLETFVRVVLPLMWPGIITATLFTLLLTYNSFLLPRLLTQSNWTLPVGIAQFTGGEGVGYITLAAAASVSVTIPIIFIIIFFQRYLIKGLAAGAVKGEIVPFHRLP